MRQNKLTAAPSFQGSLYRKSDARLMIVGRAVNGWEHDFSPCQTLKQVVAAVLNQRAPFDDVVKIDGVECKGRKRNYHYSSSKFWKLIKLILESYGESQPGEWYNDPFQWNQRIVWSNLYKVAPWAGGNPEWSFIKPQMKNHVEIIRQELEHYAPKRVLFITDMNYFVPWKREPSVLKILDFFEERQDSKYIVGCGTYKDIQITVCKRPDHFEYSNEDLANMAEEICNSFKN